MNKGTMGSYSCVCLIFILFTKIREMEEKNKENKVEHRKKVEKEAKQFRCTHLYI